MLGLGHLPFGLSVNTFRVVSEQVRREASEPQHRLKAFGQRPSDDRSGSLVGLWCIHTNDSAEARFLAAGNGRVRAWPE